MNDFAISGYAGDGRSALASSVADEAVGRSRLRIVDADVSRADLARSNRSYVSISVNADGHIVFESEVEPQHADQMTDVLLLMLLKAREARKRC